MSVKETALSVINAINDNADWSDVKSAIKEAARQDGDDVRADITAAAVVCLVMVAGLAYWLAG
ncbi:MAG: hypothetical protein ACI8VC_001953 [Candidatus Endobugula sp.]|jgi:hypothetical protein